MLTFYPAVLYQLEPKDKGYSRGARFRVDQLDGGQYAFKTREDAEAFAEMHGMDFINVDEMRQLRKVLIRRPRPT